MLSKYELHRIFTYLANAVSGLHHRNPATPKIYDWVADVEHDMASTVAWRYTGISKHHRVHLRSNPEKKEMSSTEFSELAQTLCSRCLEIKVPEGNISKRLQTLGKKIDLDQTDLEILELLLRYKTNRVFESIIDDIFDNECADGGVLKFGAPALKLLLSKTSNNIESRLQKMHHWYFRDWSMWIKRENLRYYTASMVSPTHQKTEQLMYPTFY